MRPWPAGTAARIRSGRVATKSLNDRSVSAAYACARFWPLRSLAYPRAVGAVPPTSSPRLSLIEPRGDKVASWRARIERQQMRELVPDRGNRPAVADRGPVHGDEP